MDELQKPRKNHEKKTKWGGNDSFTKSAKKAGKRIKNDSHDEDDWRNDIRNMMDVA